MPCNTAHYFIDKIKDQIPRPLIHIVESTLEQAKQKSPSGAWLIATKGTIRTGLYQRYANQMGAFPFARFRGAGQDTELHRACQENDSQAAGRALKEILSSLQKKNDVPFIAACTEIPLAFEATGLGNNLMISSLEALAVKCISVIYSDVYNPY